MKSINSTPALESLWTFFTKLKKQIEKDVVTTISFDNLRHLQLTRLMFNTFAHEEEYDMPTTVLSNFNESNLTATFYKGQEQAECLDQIKEDKELSQLRKRTLKYLKKNKIKHDSKSDLDVLLDLEHKHLEKERSKLIAKAKSKAKQKEKAKKKAKQKPVTPKCLILNGSERKLKKNLKKTQCIHLRTLYEFRNAASCTLFTFCLEQNKETLKTLVTKSKRLSQLPLEDSFTLVDLALTIVSYNHKSKPSKDILEELEQLILKEDLKGVSGNPDREALKGLLESISIPKIREFFAGTQYTIADPKRFSTKGQSINHIVHTLDESVLSNVIDALNTFIQKLDTRKSKK